MERCSCTVTEGNSHAAELECALSEGDGASLSRAIGQAKTVGHKTTQVNWLSQVNNGWERLFVSD